MERQPTRGGRKFVSVAAFLPFIALAALAGSGAAGQVWLQDRPNLSALLPLAPAEAEVRIAWAKLRATFGEGMQAFPKSVPEDITLAARRGLSAEPTSERAASILALASAPQSESRSRQTYRAISVLSKRNDIVNTWLIGDYGRLEQLDPMLRHLDYLLRTDPGKHEQLMPLVVGALAQKETIPELAKLLRADPNWADNFWNYVLIAPPVLDNAAELRARMGRGYDAGPQDFDGQLVTALVANKRYRQALAAHARLTGVPSRSLLRDPTFTRNATMPPVDWETFSEGGFDAGVDTQERALFVSADGATPVRFARQLVELPRGRLRLQSEWRTESEVGAPQMQARITCTDNGEAASSVNIQSGRRAVVLTPPSGCRYAWFELISRGSGLPYEAYVRRMSLDAVQSESN